MKKINILLVTLLSIATTSVFADVISDFNFPDSDKFEQRLEKLDSKIKKRWDKLLDKQNDNDWVYENNRYKIPGQVYSNGWLGPRVSRTITLVDNQFYAIDKISLSTRFLEQIGQIGANIFLSYHVPFTEAAYDYNKNIGHIRKFRTYKDALMAKPFDIAQVPDTVEKVEALKTGEIFTTTFNNGFYTKVGGSINSLLGITLPFDIPFGPRVKVSSSRSINLSIEKGNDSIVNLTISNSNGLKKSVGLVLGILFEDLLHIPVNITIHGQRGFAPLMLGSSKIKNKFSTINLKLDLSTEKGKEAFEAMMNRDLSKLDELIDSKSSAVKTDLVKTGTTVRKVKTRNTHLIFARYGKQKIDEWTKYTTLIDEEKFQYENGATSVKKDRQGLSGKESESYHFDILIPVTVNSAQTQVESFILESSVEYTDSKTKGREINKILDTIRDYDNIVKINLNIDKKKNYKKFYIKYTSRVSMKAIEDFLQCNKDCRWMNITDTLGLGDPESLLTRTQRRRFSERSKQNERLIYRANRLNKKISKILEQRTIQSKAKEMLKVLKSRKYGALLHKYILNLAQREDFQTNGQILGRGF